MGRKLRSSKESAELTKVLYEECVSEAGFDDQPRLPILRRSPEITDKRALQIANKRPPKITSNLIERQQVNFSHHKIAENDQSNIRAKLRKLNEPELDSCWKQDKQRWYLS